MSAHPLSRRLLSGVLTAISLRSPSTAATAAAFSTTTANLSDADEAPTAPDSAPQRVVYDRPLENGLDMGIYKAIIVGQVGQSPLQKRLRSGKVVTLFSVGTGGIRNNRRPLQNEDPREYAERCAVQWHRVTVYPEPLGGVVMKNVGPGAILYLEGNLETKIFTDPVTGLVRRIREIAIRRNGRLVFLGNAGDYKHPAQSEMKGVGYY
ncbi:hypothetical protein MLD38_023989 [Melastoma candidum]|uniref:Uncharacterized protein n=1 Tax=Melastoma candidum TaxID=119954 RepID=A0ACB9NR11_9MYRT|nr:hypothetical protein MLD38_023989 [Melastoma candidum]